MLSFDLRYLNIINLNKISVFKSSLFVSDKSKCKYTFFTFSKLIWRFSKLFITLFLEKVPSLGK
jgi:hypothetical protein